MATNIYTRPGDIKIDQYCNGVLMHNTGNTNLLVNGDLIIPGQSKSIGGNYGEILDLPPEVRFMLPTPAPPIRQDQVTVTQKYYIIPK